MEKEKLVLSEVQKRYDNIRIKYQINQQTIQVLFTSISTILAGVILNIHNLSLLPIVLMVLSLISLLYGLWTSPLHNGGNEYASLVDNNFSEYDDKDYILALAKNCDEASKLLYEPINKKSDSIRWAILFFVFALLSLFCVK